MFLDEQPTWAITSGKLLTNNFLDFVAKCCDFFRVLAIGCSMVTLFMMTEIYIYYTNFNRPSWQTQMETNNKSQLDEPEFHVPYVPLILRAINYNGLAFFLIANLFTGIVNICFQTLLLGTPASLVIITYYIFLLNVVMVFLFVNKFKLKIW